MPSSTVHPKAARAVRDIAARLTERACLADGVVRIPDMVSRMYADIDPKLHPAAARSVLAHLVHMVATGRAACEGAPDVASRYGPG